MKRSILALLLFIVAVPAIAAAAQEKTYEGDIVAVDTGAHTFTVKSTVKGEPVEMKFEVDRASEITINAERTMFAELTRGDHVKVTYATSGLVHTAKHVARDRTMMKEMTFTGRISSVDTKAHLFTVKGTDGAGEMTFHLRPTTRVYIGAEQESLIFQLHKGDEVTVHYETVAGENNVRALGFTKKPT
jgi:ribosomal protein L19